MAKHVLEIRSPHLAFMLVNTGSESSTQASKLQHLSTATSHIREPLTDRSIVSRSGPPAGTRKNQQIMMEQNPRPEERKKREEGRQSPEPKKREEWRQAPELQPEPEEPANHDGTEPLP